MNKRWRCPPFIVSFTFTSSLTLCLASASLAYYKAYTCKMPCPNTLHRTDELHTVYASTRSELTSLVHSRDHGIFSPRRTRA